MSLARTFHATTGLAGFTLRRLAAGKRFLSAFPIVLAAPAVALLLCLFARRPPEPEAFHALCFQIGTHLAPLLLALVYALALTTSEIEDGTAGYAFLGALPRYHVALVQTLVTAFGLALLAALGIAATWAVFRLFSRGVPPAPGLILPYAAAAAIAVTSYLAPLTFCGYAFRRGIAVSVALAVVCEVMVVHMPIRFAAWTVTNNVRAFILEWALEGNRGFYLLEYVQDAYEFPTPESAARHLACLVIAALFAAMIAVTRRSLARGGEGS